MHEEFIRGTASEVFEQLRRREGGVKGEIVLLVGAAERAAPKQVTNRDLSSRVDAIMREQDVDEKAALKVLAKETGIGKSELYRELQRLRK
jgi:16S rRNA (cytidine1402-2'-O)-methyltransferase